MRTLFRNEIRKICEACFVNYQLIRKPTRYALSIESRQGQSRLRALREKAVKSGHEDERIKDERLYQEIGVSLKTIASSFPSIQSI